MKKNFGSVSSRSRRALRSVICCVLIVTFCLSLSVGLGYSKFSVSTDGESLDFHADVLKFKSNPDTITYAMRRSTGNTVIYSKDHKVKVTIPANTSCKIGSRVIDERPVAYVLYTKKEASYYTPGYDDYAIEYNIRLFALYEDESKFGYAWSETQDIMLDIGSDVAVTSCHDHQAPIDRGDVTFVDEHNCFRIMCKRLFKEQNIFIDYSTGTPSTPDQP